MVVPLCIRWASSSLLCKEELVWLEAKDILVGMASIGGIGGELSFRKPCSESCAFLEFFRYMESAEHAFFRSFGHSVTLNEMDEMMGLPQVQASCDYRHPLYFEDEMEIQLGILELKVVPYAMAFDSKRLPDETFVKWPPGR